jgi:NADH dehydrogenase
MNLEVDKKIIIVGGGFGGVRTALDLASKKIQDAKITLVSDKPHFEYTPSLYRVATGRSPLEVCIPLREIFVGKKVEVIEDRIEKINLQEKTLIGSSGSQYHFRYAVLALGSETNYFNIPGIQELAFGFKSINEALRLKKHLHEILEACKNTDKEVKLCAAHIVIVGGGATGTEIAGELAVYLKNLARQHNFDPSLITLELIEASSRLLPFLPEKISWRVEKRLRSLGVNILLNRSLVKEELETVYLRDMEIKTKTMIWTAGVKPNRLYGETEGFKFDKKGRVLVDNFMQAQGFENIFVIGDGASTPYAGLAQTAIYDGRFVADAIEKKINGRALNPYRPQKPSYAIPLGPCWAAVSVGPFTLYGRLGWVVRRLADFRFFLYILPLQKAILAYRSEKTLCETCSICSLE